VEVRRRRKRRTNQPKKKANSEPNHKLRKYVLLIGIPLIVLGIGLYLMFQARYESDRFKLGVGERVSEILQAQTDFAQFEVSGLTVKNRRMHIMPKPGSVLRDADLTSLTGRLAAGSMMSSDWNLDSMAALNATLNFQAPKPSSIVKGEAESAPELQLAGLGLSKKPEVFNIEKLLVESATFNWIPSKINKPIPFVYETSVTTKKIASTTDFALAGGKFQLPPRPDYSWPDFQLDSASLRYSKGKVELLDSSLTHHTIGNMIGEATVAGTIGLDPSAPLADFTCNLFKMPAESLAHDDFKAHFSGEVDATLRIQSNLTRQNSVEISGSVSVLDGKISNIVPFKSLAALVAEPRLSDVQFHSIKADYSLEEGISTIDNLDALAPGLIHITGGYSAQGDGILKGRLQFGISDSILAEMPGGKPAFFDQRDEEKEMSYTVVEISGTRKELVENLTPRIKAAIEQFQIDSAAPPASSYPTIPRGPGAKSSKSKQKAEEDFDKLINPE